jgi:hypothetical protein
VEKMEVRVGAEILERKEREWNWDYREKREGRFPLGANP